VPSVKSEFSCSFCRKSYRELGPLVEGPDSGEGPAYICRNCAELVIQIIDTEKRRRESEANGSGPEDALRGGATDGEA
jgi:ATP-dependent Clp protease ATP-binding subunit ClpX